MLAVVHDLAEAQGQSAVSLLHLMDGSHYIMLSVGDIAPREGIPKAEKRRLESVRRSWLLISSSLIKASVPIQEAMHNFVHEMLHDSPAAQRMMVLWQVCLALS